ncbi:MAG: molybdenum cofactor guanylyltransferase [Candidatus Eremiobacteraeota bacterium]|nr:molybdenum cofactor guanylyltransferase [Candidatus Eremiobacteraeota bacterium]
MLESRPNRTNAEILLLAGGAARRFPGKLLHPIGGTPILVRTYEALERTGWNIRILCDGALPPEIEAALDVPVTIDRLPYRGPLFALRDACRALRCDYVFAAAADLPAIDSDVVQQIVQAWQPGDDGVVPVHDASIEPLAAIYRRRAILAAWPGLRRDGLRSMHALVERLATRFVPLPARYFVNVNRPSDLAAVDIA